MSLGIAFKGAEGIVLAADSRVTLQATGLDMAGQPILIPATFDNATKLLLVSSQSHVAAVTYGLGALGTTAPRTAHSFLPEFEETINQDPVGGGARRLGVEEFTKLLSDFYLEQFQKNMPANWKGPGMVFLVGGFDEREAYGRVFEVVIPHRPKPAEWKPGEFGVIWGGQTEFVNRLLNGFDQPVLDVLKKELNWDDAVAVRARTAVQGRMGAKVPYQFLPLQDCIDFSIFLIRTTMQMHRWTVDVRGVGGDIDVAAITRTGNVQRIQVKQLRGER